MSRIYVHPDPDGPLDAVASAIRRTASAAGLAAPLVRRANWLLRGSRVVAHYTYPSTVSQMETAAGRIYHRRSTNTTRLLLIALIERATSAAGTISFQPSGGATVTYEHALTGATTRWAYPAWSAWVRACDMSATGLQYHEIEWSNLVVREVLLLEVPRDQFDTDVDTCVEYQGPGYAGLRSGRMITDGGVGGVQDILGAIASARDATKRGGGGILLPDASAWYLYGPSTWGNIADAALGTSGFGFPHRARQVREATDAVELKVAWRAIYVGDTGAGFRLLSEETADAATAAMTTYWAWYTDTVDVSSATTDYLYPQATADTAETTAYVSSIQWLE